MVINEVISFIVTTPIHQSRSEEIGDVLTEYVFSKYSMHEYMKMDWDSVFMSMLIYYLMMRLGI